MPTTKLKWYGPFVLLVGTILSLTDPVTDILTAMEFYYADHKIWFYLGLAFIFFQGLVLCFVALPDSEHYVCYIITFPLIIISGAFHCPILRVEELVYYLKRWWNHRRVVTDEDGVDGAEDSRNIVNMAVLLESLSESAPQFILQLYVASVQEEPVKVIQIISLPVSFLSLVWAFTSTDEVIYEEIANTWKVKHKLALSVTHLFLLSSRLLAVCYFTVSYKWWVTVVFLFHSLLIVTIDTICGCTNLGVLETIKRIFSIFLFFVHWLRDDIVAYFLFKEEQHLLWKRQLFSHCLFISENVVIILLFYFSQQSNTWYSLPVTICVCLFSVLGAVMRIILFRQFYSKTGTIINNNDNGSAVQPTSEGDPRFGEGDSEKCPPQAYACLEASTPSGSIQPPLPPAPVPLQ